MTPRKKLVLNRQTVRTLSVPQTKAVVGGRLPPDSITFCSMVLFCTNGCPTLMPTEESLCGCGTRPD